jgi:hypothetical protein
MRHQNPDNTVKALQAAFSKVINYPVGIGILVPPLYGNWNPDFVVSIGEKTLSEFLMSGDVEVEAGERSKTIYIHGVPSYHVTASTSWGATADATDIASDHFVVEFSSPAPPPSRRRARPNDSARLTRRRP